MANVLVEEQTLQNIANSIRAKSGKTDLMIPSAMSGEIDNLPSGITNGVEYLEFNSEGKLSKARVLGDKCVNYQFYNHNNLSYVELSNSITNIGEYAFHQTSFTNMELPSGLTSIGRSAFYGCANLALTELPSSLTSIGDYAFNNCKGLTELTFRGKLSTISKSAFNNCTNILTINVPWAEGEVANAPWGATNATINYNHVG